MADSKYTRYTTPEGSFRYPYLVRPDTKYEPKFGVYRVDQVLSEEDAQPLVALIKEGYKEAKAEAAEKGGKNADNKMDPPFEIEENGNYVFSIKVKGGGYRRDGSGTFTRNIPVFDAAGNLIEGDVRIGTGTRGRVSLELRPYYMPANGYGVSLRLKAAQVIDLVEWGASAETYGFEEEEGFVHDSDPFEGEEPASDAQLPDVEDDEEFDF